MEYDTIILGAGAAGLMCAAHCGGRVLVVDHARKPAEKIRISGGGRCNFTNLDVTPEKFISANPHFARSALARYTQWDFIDLLARHGITWHEKTLGQLFCDGRSAAIIDMLLRMCARAGAEITLETTATAITPLTRSGNADDATGYGLTLSGPEGRRQVRARRLVLATGGKSIPKMGATGFAYDVAAQFGHSVTQTRPALVPLTFSADRFRPLAGTALPARVAADGPPFDEALLFTHRGLSGPAILQASSYWREGAEIVVNLCPGADAYAVLRAARTKVGRRSLVRSLDGLGLIPARLADHLGTEWVLTGNLADQSDRALQTLADRLTHWRLTPSGSEGYRTAEVTLGGIDTAEISSKTMESRRQPGLYFIGECVDVTGWLGGYNFQWAWSSAMAAATAIAAA
ncbi:NAD(P)/FAD-dependent oxidoreductase [Pseudooceanicola aestuarii]|uniref:NAD(P)/FAD-dependent oxidoreductase n=1 Tax=Pseudooceanicola aestuarii TaxID=2697319 RepID=UPI0013D4C1EB|nr:NAD(P)/FAD-dependent oxidoreductase [Pseudooceanicola aestuarii]